MDNTKEEFLRVWPGGYRENWAVYGAASGKTEAEVVNRCLAAFYNKNKTCLEVGCGLGFWTEKYLAPNFKHVTALDLLPTVKFRCPNISYIEVPDRDFSCHGVPDNSIDFCWSFGVFCHLSLDACQQYLDAIFNKLVKGGQAILFFSNENRRPKTVGATKGGIELPIPSSNPTSVTVQWVRNDFNTTEKMLAQAGFTNVEDLMPDLIDTMIFGQKPY